MITFLKFDKVKSLVKRMLSAFPFKFGLFNLNSFFSIFSPFFVSKKITKIGRNVKIKFVIDRTGHDIRYAINSAIFIIELLW